MKNHIINFDNAATTFPKPDEVKKSVIYAIEHCGGSAGRGGHNLSMHTSQLVYNARQAAADFFDAQTENVIFTSSCTHALNTAIKGVLKDGGHVVASSIEHNSVIRPLMALSKQGKITLSIAKVYDDNSKTIDSFENAINVKTQVVICTIAGNVTGQLLPIKEIAEMCNKRNICFIADGAQACGIIPVSLKSGINILCTSGHKGLYGIAGTGLLVTDGKYKIEPLTQGGTGSGSLEFTQPDFMPDSLESGTLNTPGILSLKAGIDFINKRTIQDIFRYEEKLADIFLSNMRDFDKITIYRSPNAKYVPIISFNVKDIPSEKFASYLNEKGFCLRAGFHCSAMAHKSLGTKNGTIRFAPSVFNTESDVKKLCLTIKNAF